MSSPLPFIPLTSLLLYTNSPLILSKTDPFISTVITEVLSPHLPPELISIIVSYLVAGPPILRSWYSFEAWLCCGMIKTGGESQEWNVPGRLCIPWIWALAKGALGFGGLGSGIGMRGRDKAVVVFFLTVGDVGNSFPLRTEVHNRSVFTSWRKLSEKRAAAEGGTSIYSLLISLDLEISLFPSPISSAPSICQIGLEPKLFSITLIIGSSPSGATEERIGLKADVTSGRACGRKEWIWRVARDDRQVIEGDGLNDFIERVVNEGGVNVEIEVLRSGASVKVWSAGIAVFGRLL